MNFYSIQFLLFLGILLIAYYIFLKKYQWQCILIGSIVFYLWTGPVNMIFLITTGFTTWAGSLFMEKYSDEFRKIKADKTIDKGTRKLYKKKFEKKKKIVLLIVLLINFGILAYLKYWKVILENVASVIHVDPASFSVYNQALGLLLPLGISFYTFQSVGYLLDVYHDKSAAQKNFGKYLLFVAYFPQLIQGPINRYDKMEPEFEKQHRWDSANAKAALLLILFGMVKKYAIANLTVGLIADILDRTGAVYPGSVIVTGILLYSAQQYADFSGGIDMVLGISQLFGIAMMPNFRQPYFATSISDFWRRWHISLGAWMRDYIFYPFALTRPMQNLGKWAKNKMGKHIGRVLPAAISNILVFFVVGLWHGAEWHFILWGLYNGIVIAISDFLEPVFAKMTGALHINTEAKWYHVFRVIRTFIVVNIGWYFDRIADISVCLESMKSTVTHFKPAAFLPVMADILSGYSLMTFAVAAVAIVFVFCHSVLKERGVDTIQWLDNRSIVIRWGIIYFMIFIVLVSFTCDMSAGGFMYANY